MLKLALILFAQAGAANAALDCNDPQTQVAMNMCSLSEYERADAALNAQWSRTAAKMRAQDQSLAQMNADIGREGDGLPGYFESLLEGQRAWLKYRDAHCTSIGFFARGGSMSALLVNDCLISETNERTAELKELAGGMEGWATGE